MIGLSETFHAYSGALWQARRERLGEKAPKWERELSAQGSGPLLRYILSTVPLSDLGEYPTGLFASFARHACHVRETYPWCRALPEALFLRDVLAPRINTEELAGCRPLFEKELAPRVQGLALPQAILEVNRWCAEHVTYRSTDDRTSSPLAVYKRGWGRCGEESTFAVTALRSVGIAARQVYAPWWSHCDDNHAWVEAWDGQTWRYMGACEPEPELDRGWFTGAAARAMLIHTRNFIGDLPAPPWLYPGTEPTDLDAREGVMYETLTARYAPTQLCTVTAPPGARLTFSVVNMAALRPIAERAVDETGAARLRLGLGSVHVTAEKEGFFAEALWDTRGRASLVLEGGASGGSFTFASPSAPASFPAPLAPEQKARREAILAQAASLRREIPPKPAQGALALLTEKDRSEDIDPGILEPCALDQPAELASPRIGLEPLHVWQAPSVGRSPEEMWRWVQALPNLEGYRDLPQSPLSALNLGAAGKQGRRVLFCGLCRQAGIPARLSPLDGEPEYGQDGAFIRLAEPATARLRLRAPSRRGAACGQDYTLSRWQGGAWRVLSTGDLPPGGEAVIALPPGRWRLLTVLRLPSGSQLGRQEDIGLQADEEREAALVFPQAASAQLLQSLPLPPFAGRERLHDSPFTLFCWLEPGREPTEHLQLELKEQEAGFAAWQDRCAVHIFTPGEPGFAELPALARQLFVDPERLPLVLLADSHGRGLYACSGYNVGIGALLLRLLEAAEKTEKEKDKNGT